jgi:hypothetical protein
MERTSLLSVPVAQLRACSWATAISLIVYAPVTAVRLAIDKGQANS